MKFRSIAHTAYTISVKWQEQWGKLNRLRAAWWGVELGTSSHFIGRCFFKKYPGTNIAIGKDCTFLSKAASNLIGINRPCILSTHQSDYQATIKIGNQCGFSGTVIGAFRSISIGNHVRCGANTLITDADWHLDDPRSGEPAPIVIGDNVWLGVNCTVMKGVTIGANTVIGANSVVTKSIPANVIAAGNPCRVIRELPVGKNAVPFTAQQP
ncbi:acyltransferase [Paraflavitalea sp. CAU 1676]|uniref:acyltransferase n=1 Tax=Paraflavitalea sp. CAU 1676 TaxID=3032598 RepID=UPI0023DC2EFA|nr:acyltransferase [Paraflavitalea sp. CAU 1676]MDF2189181.1 acyltransferase [Paraflavitalea sp. CAU 1676]